MARPPPDCKGRGDGPRLPISKVQETHWLYRGCTSTAFMILPNYQNRAIDHSP